MIDVASPQAWPELRAAASRLRRGMSRRHEFLSPEGLRVDGRRANEARLLNCRLGELPNADGSAYLEQGNTKVLVSVEGPHEASSGKRARGGGAPQHDRATLNVEFVAVPYATGEYKPQSLGDRTAAELGAAIRRAFEPVVQAQLYPRSQIDVSITLLQSDGGVRSAAINATTLALIDAGVALEDFICACSAGSIQGALLLDLNSQEDGAGAELSVGYLPHAERVSFVQLESKLPLSAMEEALNFAIEGCRQVYQVLREAVERRMQLVLSSRGMLNG